MTSNINQNMERWAIHKSAVCDANGIVAAQHHLAAAAGGDVLHRGGNAIDAAIGAALALGVVEPWMSGLGGSGLMIIWLAEEKRAITLDFQGMLSEATSGDDYPIDDALPITLMGFGTVVGNANIEGPRSITVPGAAAGFDLAATRYGTMTLADIAAPAITLARQGITADWFTTLQSALMMSVISSDPVSKSIYLPGGAPIEPGNRLFIPGLADTISAFAETGADGFYTGELSRKILADLKQVGSKISADDFASYVAIEKPSMQTTHRGIDVHTLGDSSGGTRMRDCLNYISARLPNPPVEPTPETWGIYADALDAAWRSHNARIGRATEVGSCTSSLSTVDAKGNMVTLTHTLLNPFGSGVTLPQSGLLMNNAVSYFDPLPGKPTSMKPRMRVNASNICPAIGVRDGVSQFAVGASGGNHIMPAVTQVAALMMDFDMSLETSMNHPRIDASDRGSVRVDPALGSDVMDVLSKNRELEIAQRLVFPKLYACVSGVSRVKNGEFTGINDPSQPVGDAYAPKPLKTDGAP